MKQSLLIALLFAVACGSGDAEEPKRQPRVVDENAGWDKLALYIGIDKYVHKTMKAKSLKGCVNDMHNLRHVLETQYGFPPARSKMLDTVDETTWKGIKAGLEWLMRQVDKAVDPATKNGSKNPLVVIAYAGHGGQVPSLDNVTEGDDSEDETWVPSNVGNRGYNDIRDNDVAKVVGYLCDKGATVVRYQDSCHSGTGYRDAEAAMTRSRGDLISLDAKPPPMFPDMPDLDLSKSPSYVYFASAQDNQPAKEGVDDSKRPCGRYTYAFVRALKNSQGASYEELSEEAERIMAATWEGAPQRPNFRGFGGEGAKPSFRVKDPLPPHVRWTKQTGRFVHIEAGSLQGIRQGQRFDFYESLQKLREGTPLVLGGARMFGTAQKVEPGSTKVALERSEKLPKTAVAAMNVIAIPDFTISVQGEMPDKVKTRLAELAEKKLIERDDDSFSLQLRWHKQDEKPHLRLYWPDRLWEAGKTYTKKRPDPFALEFYYDHPEADLGQVLTQLALRKRMLRMTRNETSVGLSMELDKDADEPLGKELDKRNTTRVFETGYSEEHDIRAARVLFKIKNRSKKKLWVLLFLFEEYQFEKNGRTERRNECDILHPGDDTDEKHYTLEPGGELTIPKWLWPGPQDRSNVANARAHVRLKLLATSKPYKRERLAHICRPLDLGSRAGDEDDELVKLLENLGTSSQRGSGDPPVKTFWATKVLAYDVVDPAKK